MNYVDALMIAGLGIVVVGFILSLIAKRRGDPIFGDLHPGGLMEAYALAAWTGMLLMQASNILLHRQSGGLYNISTLTWAATAAELFVCGALSGRVLLRLEIRRRMQKLEETSAT